MRRIIIFPAVFVGCMVVIWIGTMASVVMPSQALLAPTLTARAKFEQSDVQDDEMIEMASAENTLHDESSQCSLPSSYPDTIQQWCGLIESAAADSGLPADLIAAVMLQESGGDPLSYSSSGAVGLMQVMPRDGISANFICINGPCFASRPTIEELQDPAFNINYGSRMLADLHVKNGSYREALFRYGPSDMGYHYADLVLKIWENYQ